MNYQLKLGKKVEREHKGTYAKVKARKIKTAEQFYENIASDHLKESKTYYSRLKKAGL